MELAQYEKLLANGAIKTLRFTCAKCTRQGNFVGESRKHAVRRAIEAGWRGRKNERGEEIQICPRCY